MEIKVVFVPTFFLDSTPQFWFALYQRFVHFKMLSSIKIKCFRALMIFLWLRVLHLRDVKNAGANINCFIPHPTKRKGFLLKSLQWMEPRVTDQSAIADVALLLPVQCFMVLQFMKCLHIHMILFAAQSAGFIPLIAWVK